MSKKRSERKAEKKTVLEAPPQNGRRKFLLLGAAAAAGAAGLGGGYAAGWFGSGGSNAPGAQPVAGKLPPLTLDANLQNARRAADDMLEFYARQIGNASVLIHAVRGFGKRFTLADGSSAVSHLCSRYALEKEAGGKKHLLFKRDAEVHENSFLKTFLEAGVPMDQAIVPANATDGRRGTLAELAEGAKALFRCDPKDLYRFDADSFRYDPTPLPPRLGPDGKPLDLRGELLHEHLPWGLIAFSTLTKPEQAIWTNAYGETIDLAAVIDRSLAEYESTCSLGQQAISGGNASPEEFRAAIKRYSCFGLHSVYAYLVCFKQGFTGNRMAERVSEMMEFLSFRLKADSDAIDREYAQTGQGAAPALVEAFRIRAQVKHFGHAFESINYARLHNLVKFTPATERRIQAGEQAFYENIVRLRALDWETPRKQLGEKFVSDIVISLGHAARALKLQTPQNPDTIA